MFFCIDCGKPATNALVLQVNDELHFCDEHLEGGEQELWGRSIFRYTRKKV